MHDPIALTDTDERSDVTEELVAAAIAGLVRHAHAQGQSLDDLTRLVMEEDAELDGVTRQWLSDIVAEAWQEFSVLEMAA